MSKSSEGQACPSCHSADTRKIFTPAGFVSGKFNNESCETCAPSSTATPPCCSGGTCGLH